MIWKVIVLVAVLMVAAKFYGSTESVQPSKPGVLQARMQLLNQVMNQR